MSFVSLRPIYEKYFSLAESLPLSLPRPVHQVKNRSFSTRAKNRRKQRYFSLSLSVCAAMHH